MFLLAVSLFFLFPVAHGHESLMLDGLQVSALLMSAFGTIVLFAGILLCASCGKGDKKEDPTLASASVVSMQLSPRVPESEPHHVTEEGDDANSDDEEDELMDLDRAEREKEEAMDREIEELSAQVQILNEILARREFEIEQAKKGIENFSLLGSECSLIFPMSVVVRTTTNFSLEKKIGEGGSGQVYKGRIDQLLVAIKRLNADSLATSKHFQTEILTASQCRHPYLLPIMGFTDLQSPNPCLIFPLMPQGNLRDRLDRTENTEPIPWDLRVRIAFEAAAALSYLHSPFKEAASIVHLDVKSDNILLDNEYRARLSDFGLSRFLGEKNALQTRSPFGTLGYICPELLTDGTISTKSDVYSFGVVMFEILTTMQVMTVDPKTDKNLNLWKLMQREMPTPESNFKKDLLDETIREVWPEENYQLFAKLARECINNAPEMRPSMNQVADRLQQLL